jgi:hypothetical protein
MVLVDSEAHSEHVEVIKFKKSKGPLHHRKKMEINQIVGRILEDINQVLVSCK